MVLTELVAKELEMMKQAVPHMTRVGVLVTLTAPSHRPALKAAETTARQLGIQVLPMAAQTIEDLDRAFDTMTRERVGGVLVPGSALTASHRTRLADLGLKHRLPSMYRQGQCGGGLMSYGPSYEDQLRRSADYVDKILKGAKPSGLPIEQPAKFTLVVNLKTARLLGITIAESIILRADEVIR